MTYRVGVSGDEYVLLLKDADCDAEFQVRVPEDILADYAEYALGTREFDAIDYDDVAMEFEDSEDFDKVLVKMANMTREWIGDGKPKGVVCRKAWLTEHES